VSPHACKDVVGSDRGGSAQQALHI
jgi:hypothetical protein